MVSARADGADAEKRVRSQMQAMGLFMAVTVMLLVLLVALEQYQAWPMVEDKECKVWLVQSIPTDKPELRPVPDVLSTSDVLRWLAGNATKVSDVTAQYWELLADPGDPLLERGVSIRILQHTGFSPSFDAESAALAAGRPNVRNRTLLLTDWWGSGIVHSKLWMVNREHAYLGSASNDWKSLTQVKEVGVYFISCPTVVKLLEGYFNNFWTLTSFNASQHTSLVLDQQWQLSGTVSCWSHFVDSNERCLYVSLLLPRRFIACGSIKAMMSPSPLLDVQTAVPEIHCNITCAELSLVV